MVRSLGTVPEFWYTYSVLHLLWWFSNLDLKKLLDRISHFWVAKSFENSVSERYRCSVRQEITHILCNPKIRNCVKGALHCLLSWARWIQSTLSHCNYITGKCWLVAWFIGWVMIRNFCCYGIICISVSVGITVAAVMLLWNFGFYGIMFMTLFLLL
jgi:hypothetical protein